MAKIYALDAKEMQAIATHLTTLDNLTTDVRSGAVVDVPERITFRDSDNMIIGHAIFEDGFWAFEATTVEEREKKEEEL